MTAYLDQDELPYVHLVDGGISDNLGVRGPLNEAVVEGGLWQRLQDIGAKGRPRHLVFIVVDASTNPVDSFALGPSPPSLLALINSTTDTQLHRYNFETVDLLRHSLEDWGARFAREGQPLSTHLIEVAEYRIDDPEEREFFDGVPTSLGLDEETVDRLVALGRRLLRESKVFQELLAELPVPPLSETGPGSSSRFPVRFEPVREAESVASLALSR